MDALTSNLRQLGDIGFPEASWLASGMEGEVFLLHPDLVGKIWPLGGEPMDAVEDLFAELAVADLPFSVPRPLGRRQLPDGRTISLERYLPGTELSHFYSPDDGVLQPHVVEALISVLSALRGVTLGYTGYQVLGELRPYVAGTEDWREALVSLVDRRLDRFGPQLEAVVDNYKAVVTGLRNFVLNRRMAVPSIVHGDIFGGNVLVDEDSSVVALVDWGFLTVPADPAFDAAITAGVFDLYGPFAERTETTLTTAFSEAFGYTPTELAAYKGIYALITSNSYDETGQDGHFRWCSSTLCRREIQEAALAPAPKGS